MIIDRPTPQISADQSGFDDQNVKFPLRPAESQLRKSGGAIAFILACSFNRFRFGGNRNRFHAGEVAPKAKATCNRKCHHYHYHCVLVFFLFPMAKNTVQK